MGRQVDMLTCTDAYMHYIKGVDQMRGDSDIYIGLHRGVHVCPQLIKGG